MYRAQQSINWRFQAGPVGVVITLVTSESSLLNSKQGQGRGEVITLVTSESSLLNHLLEIVMRRVVSRTRSF